MSVFYLKKKTPEVVLSVHGHSHDEACVNKGKRYRHAPRILAPGQQRAATLHYPPRKTRKYHQGTEQKMPFHGRGLGLEDPRDEHGGTTVGDNLDVSEGGHDRHMMQLALHKRELKPASGQFKGIRDQAQPSHFVNAGLSSALIQRANACNFTTLGIQPRHDQPKSTSHRDTSLIVRHKSTESLSHLAKPGGELCISHPAVEPIAARIFNNISLPGKPTPDIFELGDASEADDTAPSCHFAFVDVSQPLFLCRCLSLKLIPRMAMSPARYLEIQSNTILRAMNP